MKLIRKTRLWSQQANSDKVYEVDLCEVGTNRYVVNFRYGRRGGNLREGSKTVAPVTREEGEAIFDSLVVSKLNKGYQDSATQTPPDSTHTAPTQDSADDRDKTLLKHLNDTRNPKLNRLIWRVGELRLRAAVPRLQTLAERTHTAGDALREYCVAWALGRCGDATAVPTLTRLHNAGQSEAVRRIALLGLLSLAEASEQDRLLTGISEQLPVSMRASLADEDRLRAALHQHLAHTDVNGYVVLEQLYLLAGRYPCARAVLLQELRTVPLKPNYFQRIRHIFKMAEWRPDSVVFGLLTQRFETEPALFYRSAWGGDYVQVPGGGSQYVKLSKEIRKANSRLAYSNRTRDYLRRRAWRTLRRLGEAADDSYIELALEVLLAMRDEDATATRQSTIYHYDWSKPWPEARQVAARHTYDGYAGYLVLNHILHGNSVHYFLSKSGRAWQRRDSCAGPEEREEAFPELWDRHPDALLQLLTNSRCEPVHVFAAKALRANQDYCARLDTASIALLLRQTYSITAELGLHLVRARYTPEEPDLALLQALLDSELPAARQQALDWLDSSRDALCSDSAFVAALLSSRFAEPRAWAAAQLPALDWSRPQAEALITRVLTVLLQMRGSEPVHAAIAQDISTALLGAFPQQLRSLGLEIIEDLLYHPLTEVQVLAGRLLLNHERGAETLPPAVFKALLEATAPEVQGIGIQLLGQLPDDILMQQQALLTGFCVAEAAELRQSAHPVAQGLVQRQPEYGQQLLLDLLPYVFRKEPVEGFHADILALLQSQALAGSVVALDRATVWRLLKARARAAQALGGHILQQHIQADELSVRQWAWLADHPHLAVREWARQAYRQHPEMIKQAAGEALRILDSEWDDTRAFAIDYFSTQFSAADWTPELLISICDSVRDDVQAFGRDLISRFFDEARGAEYLLKLSQHPSTSVQLFASNFLQAYAAGQPERLAALTPYFLTVLAQVNRSRTAKTRILRFLHQEALQDRAAALVAAPIFNRQSATAAMTDKATCLEALRDIQQHYPDLELALTVKPVRQYVRSRSGQHGA